MGVEPEDEEFASGTPAVPGHTVDRTDREAVVAAEHDGDLARRHRVEHPVADGARPGRHVGDVAQRRHGLQGRRRPGRDVAVVDDGPAEVFELGRKARGAQGRRPHDAARLVRAGLQRDADQSDDGVAGR